MPKKPIDKKTTAVTAPPKKPVTPKEKASMESMMRTQKMEAGEEKMMGYKKGGKVKKYKCGGKVKK